MAEEAKPKKFEDELKDLEQIVAKMDSGELSLEDSIAAFERGVALVNSLHRRLDEIEKKVEVLTRNSQGALRTAPFEGAGKSKSAKSNAADGDDEDVQF